MAKKRNSTRTKTKFDLGFWSQSRFAFLIVLSNLLAFLALHYLPVSKNILDIFVLSPDNLLRGKIWTLLSSGFIHRDWAHLLLNMLGVVIFGRIVERQMGLAKAAFVYFGALLISMLFATTVYAGVLHRSVAIIGASGAVMGLISAAMLLEPFSVTYEMILPIPVMIKGWMFLFADLQGFLGGEREGISHLAHLFGFLSVAVLVYFLSQKDQKTMGSGLMINLVSFMGFLFLRKWLTTGGL